MTFLKFCRASKRAPWLTLCWQFAFFAVGVIMVLIINGTVNKDKDFACMGTLLATVGMLVGVMARGNTTCADRFRLAVAMGQTRRAFLLWDTVLTALTVLLGLLFGWILYHLEMALYEALYPGYTNIMLFNGFYRLPVLAAVVAGGCILNLLFGTIQMKLGPKGLGMGTMVFWLVCMLFSQAISQAGDGRTTLFARFGSWLIQAICLLSPVVWACIGVAVAAALLIASLLFFRKAEARL